MAEILNLVFEGGGVRCAAYAGAISELEKRGLLASVRNVAGTSAGAITASILAVGADAAVLEQTVLETRFDRFLDGRWGFLGNVVRFLRDHGFHPGRAFCKILRRQLAMICGDPDITLGELSRRAEADPERYRHFWAISSNITRQVPEVLCAAKHPDLELWRAVRMSISIPLVFAPVRYRKSIYCDGGVAWNYPIDLFDHPDPDLALRLSGLPTNSATLGFYLGTKSEIEADRDGWSALRAEWHGLGSYLRALGGFAINSANVARLHADDVFRTVFIDDLGIVATDFNAPEGVIRRLIDSGRRGMVEYLDGPHRG